MHSTVQIQLRFVLRMAYRTPFSTITCQCRTRIVSSERNVAHIEILPKHSLCRTDSIVPANAVFDLVLTVARTSLAQRIRETVPD